MKPLNMDSLTLDEVVIEKRDAQLFLQVEKSTENVFEKEFQENNITWD